MTPCVAEMPRPATLCAMPGKSTHQAAIEALLPRQARAEYARRVRSLLARNAMVTALESSGRGATPRRARRATLNGAASTPHADA